MIHLQNTFCVQFQMVQTNTHKKKTKHSGVLVENWKREY